jgi:septum formation protein
MARTPRSRPSARSGSGSAVSSSPATAHGGGAPPRPPLLILASASKRRRELLTALGVAFEALDPDVEELTSGDPALVVVENAVRKARDGARRSSGPCVVVGADTDVVIGDRILGKPTDEDQAREMIGLLAGAVHEVHGGVAVIDGDSERTAHAITRVGFRELSQSALDAYVGSGAWRGFAGGYAIQGLGSMLVDWVDGEVANVIGLPLADLIRIYPDLLADSSP